MTAGRAFLVVLVLVSCVKKKTADDRITCDQYFEHTSKVTGFVTKKPYNDAELAYCRSHTQEQLRCVLATKTVDDLNLCTLPDTAQRTIAARIGPSIKKEWPGSAELMAVLTTTSGCGYGGFAPVPSAISETEAVIAFSIREASTTGDPPSYLVRMRRESDGWKCVLTDPEGQCERVERECRRH